MRTCANCGKREEDDRLVACPSCGASYAEQRGISEELIVAIKRDVTRDVVRRLAKYIFGGLSLMTLIDVVQCGVQFGALWNAGVTRLQRSLNQRIDEEFKSERIHQTVNSVASEQAKGLLTSSVQPQIDKVRRETQEKVSSFDRFLQDLRRQNEATYAELGTEVSLLKERTRLMELADKAVNGGDRKALEELLRISDDGGSRLSELAGSLMFQVKNFYVVGSRTAGHKLVVHRFGLGGNEEATQFVDDKDYSTEDLIHELQFGENWQDRATSAKLLGERKIRSVPEALFNAVKDDSHLEVVRDAVRAFSKVTGYKSVDVFGGGMQGWWKEHNKRL